MSNPIKYTTGSETLALKKGNFYIGTGDVGKGPSDTTGFYQGPNVPSGGYVIYMNREGAPGNLSYHTATNDSELIAFTNNLAGQSYTTVNECLVYYAGQTDKVCLNRNYEGIVTDGLILNMDGGFTPSYPKNGTTWYDISTDTNNGTLTNGPTFDSGNGGCIVLDGSNDYVNCGNLNITGGFTYEVWTNPTSFSSGSYGLLGQGPTSNNQGLHIVYTTGSRGMIFGMYANDNDYRSTYRPATGSWYHWVFTYNGTSYLKQFFVNGILRTPAGATSNAYLGTGQLNIGATYSSAQSPANGKFAIARLYNRVLTSDEILQNYNAQKGRFGL